MSLNGPSAAAPRPARIFVSYTRRDSALAGEIAAGLRFAGFDVLIDEESIERGEAWKAKLSSLIISADTVVFLLSPLFMESEVCAWELEQAVANGKRLAPVLLEETPNAPPVLSSLNYVRFDGGRSFMSGLEQLTRTLKVDLPWIHDHTRLQQRALDWKAAGGADDNRLLIGKDAADAQTWLNAANEDLPAVTDEQRAFIRACVDAQARRDSEERKRLEAVGKAQRRTGWALAGVFLAVLAGIGLGIAQARGNAVNEAMVQTGFVDLRLREERYDSAMRVAASGLASGEAFWKPYPTQLEWRLRAAAALDPHIATGGEDALAARLPQLAAEFDLPPEDLSLLEALIDLEERAGALRPGANIVLTSPDRRRKLQASMSSGEISLIDTTDADGRQRQITRITAHSGALTAAGFSPDSALLATADRDGAVLFWNARTGAALGRLAAQADRLAFDETGRFMRIWRREDAVFSLYDLHNLLKAARPNETIADAYISADGQGVLVRRNLGEAFRLFSSTRGVYGRQTDLGAPPPSGAGFLWPDSILSSIASDGLVQSREACPDVFIGSAQPPAWTALTRDARDWGAHMGRGIIAVVHDDGRPPSIHDASGAERLRLPDLGAGVLDAKFGCAGEQLYTIDEAGRFLKWSLQPLIDSPSSHLLDLVCATNLSGDSSIRADEAAFVHAKTCN